MDINLTDSSLQALTQLTAGKTYFMQGTNFDTTGTIGFTQDTTTPTTFFWGRSFKFKVKSGHTVYIKAGKIPKFPIKIHIEEI